MRVALITDGIWPYVLGGMQKHSYYLCKYFAANKVHVHLVHFNQSVLDIQKLEFFSQEEKQYITHMVIDFPSGPSFPGHYLYKSYRYSKLVFDHIAGRLQDFDLIYCKGFSGWYLLNQKAAGKIAAPPVGIKFHGYEMFQSAPELLQKMQQVLLLRRPVKNLSLKADIVFSYGGEVTKIIRSLGVRQERIIEVASGIEEKFLVRQARTTGRSPVLLFLGRSERRKGIKELSAALKKMAGDFRGEFHFIGPIAESEKTNLPFITYHGEIRDRELLLEKIRGCDVLVCPSWAEGFPNVILEAMSNGLAVASTMAGASGLLVDESTGWIIPGAGSDDIAATLEKIMQSSAGEIDRKKQQALERIRDRYTWEKLAPELLEKIRVQLTGIRKT